MHRAMRKMLARKTVTTYNMECFICADEKPALIPSPCRCKNIYVHKKCLERLLICQNDTTCRVCQSLYKHVTLQRMITYKFYSVFSGIVIVGLSTLVSIACAIFTIHAVSRDDLKWTIIPWVMLVLNVMLMVIAYIIVYMHGGVCAVYRTAIHERVVMNVATPGESV